MAHSVIIWRITSTFTDTAPGPGGPYTLAAGSYIHAVLDDATNTLTAKYSSTSADNTGFEITGGPYLFNTDPTGSVVLETIAPFYQYCEGTTLHQVGTSNGWPYATLSNNENNSECKVNNVCDLEISSVHTVTPVSAPGNSDGSIVGSATSSNGLIKYSMDPNFPYGSAVSGATLAPLADWTVDNTSFEPIAWTTGSEPYTTLTPPTIQNPSFSDIFRSPFTTAWIIGQKYTFSYNFRATSQNSNYRYIYLRAYDLFMNVLAEKVVAGYGSPGGTEGGTFQGQWTLFAPAGMRYIGLTVSYFGIVTGTDELKVLKFEEVLTVDAPGVKTELNFSGLAAGTYTIYAKDAAGCQDSLSFVVEVTEVENVRYRLDFKDNLKVSSRYHRINIYERAYTGETEEVCGGDHPVIVRYEGDANDPNKPLIPSNMELKLMCMENEQFANIFLSDDRKYRLEHYTDDNPSFSTASLYWSGYVVPEFYSEPYIAPPFEVTITLSDQIGELKNLEFLDAGGNKYRGEMTLIKIISEVLKKTDLELPIRSGVNVWADNMNQDDDPLLQALVDVRLFEGKKCDYVLQEIAKIFRGQMFQSAGYWWFIRLSDAIGTFTYREYTFEGEISSSGSFASMKELGFPNDLRTYGAMFADRAQILSFMRNYGKFSISQNLGKDGNLIDEGRFEEDDTEMLGSGNIGFKRWSTTIGQSGVTFGLEKVDNGDSKGAFFFDFSSAAGSQNDTVVYSDVLPFDVWSSGRIRFKFQYMISPAFRLDYARIAWGIKYVSAGSGDEWWVSRADNGAWTIDNVETKNDIYVTSFDTWQTFDVVLELPNLFAVASVQIFFWFNNHAGRDFEDIADLQASTSPPNGAKYMVAVGTETYVYSTEYSYDAESLPDVVRPADYDSGSGDHRILYILDKIYPLPPGEGLINRIKLDNVLLASYPIEPLNSQSIDPPETLTHLQVIDPSNKSNLGLEVILGDMLRIDETPDRYKNEKYIYHGYIRLSDGTPTRNWHRLDVEESKLLLRITLEDYMSQFSIPQRKLSGPVVSARILNYIDTIRDNINMIRYRPMTFVFNAKRAEYTIDMSAVNAGPDGEPPVIVGAYNSGQFDESFDIGN
jgi:hypothetical protein